jgi:hypothetical protein
MLSRVFSTSCCLAVLATLLCKSYHAHHILRILRMTIHGQTPQFGVCNSKINTESHKGVHRRMDMDHSIYSNSN